MQTLVQVPFTTNHHSFKDSTEKWKSDNFFAAKVVCNDFELDVALGQQASFNESATVAAFWVVRDCPNEASANMRVEVQEVKLFKTTVHLPVMVAVKPISEGDELAAFRPKPEDKDVQNRESNETNDGKTGKKRPKGKKKDDKEAKKRKK